MTTITIDLPEAIAAPLRANALALKMSFEAYVQACMADFTLTDESALCPIDLSPEELIAVENARLDRVNGNTFTHEQVMSEMRSRRVG